VNMEEGDVSQAYIIKKQGFLNGSVLMFIASVMVPGVLR
jgi:hypothetical protein